MSCRDGEAQAYLPSATTSDRTRQQSAVAAKRGSAIVIDNYLVRSTQALSDASQSGAAGWSLA
jgi:hypothetical protein